MAPAGAAHFITRPHIEEQNDLDWSVSAYTSLYSLGVAQATTSSAGAGPGCFRQVGNTRMRLIDGSQDCKNLQGYEGRRGDLKLKKMYVYIRN